MAAPRDTWILMRGLSREAGHWGGFVPALGAALPGAEVVAVDLPGVGACRDEAWPATIIEAMELVRARAASRLSGGRTFVFGVSLGGMITLEWAARHPGELAGVVVGASSASDVAPFWKRMRPRALAAMVAAGARGDAAREAAIVRVICNHADVWAETTAAWQAIQRDRPIAAATTRRQLVTAARWRAPASLSVPSLFLVGDADRLVHADCSRALAGRYRAPLRVHPTAGHDLTTDAGSWVAEQITGWRRDIPDR